MAVVTFFTNCKDQTGNTTSALALATYLGIEKNKRTLYISTSFNDKDTKRAFWADKTNKKSGLFGPNTAAMSDNGIEGLDRVIRSNKISPDIITDYTKAVLKNRLEVLFGYKGTPEQYKMIQSRYPQIINIASKFYDTVIVDIDKELQTKTKLEILEATDIIVAMNTQKLENIAETVNLISEGAMLKQINTMIVLGRYDDKSKYNAKNISRNYLKQKEVLNTIPYNTNLFEAMQEGQMIDLFLKLLNLKGRDENTFLLEEVKRLSDNIDDKILTLKQMGH